jgi:hypothetical protein
MFAGFGAVAAGFVVTAAVEEAVTASAAVSDESAILREFVDIQPRAVWPAEFGDSAAMDKDIERNFIASFEARDVRLTADQKQVVRFVIVPRLKELTARSVDKAKAKGLTKDEDIVRVILDDVMVNSPRYAKAMATILRADKNEVTTISVAATDDR